MSPPGDGPLGIRPLAAGLLRSLRRVRRDTREPGLVNHVSLGSHCHAAQVLKTLGLRTWSGPFDWIFTTPGMVRDCLADDFAALLDRSQYETIPVAERLQPNIQRCRHRLYRERYALPCVFNHHDPAESEADYAFLSAGVRRLRAALSMEQASNHFWLMTAYDTPAETVEGICDVLAQRGARNRLTFLHLVPDRESARTLPQPAGRDNLRWLRVELPSASVGLRFARPQDDAYLAALVTAEVAL
ncbi:DUF1796 family putative cysteine peptidase [Methylobacterium oxalidis]|uniref:Peptidase n=1 Tax=Methylobacterium oxalidis TaxID=944322 RepID=A0A512J766_9HYPH|nr:DUF1796 family putative cysteine peptidase [Methylobacterium oxalidis]GEP05732.1 hypothetical protein MOX02_37700 [Methylobacterium oxalidis]GJE32057.1 hypothetical protein LDDCCGHA_2239 [Methylobacterium oxalidis]GLS67931.1 hypothetical protein GCM10007888_63160 [Methylobacterium oxalidis]